MRFALVLLALAVGVVTASSQGNIRFSAQLSGASEVPPNPSLYAARASFWLDGDLFSYAVGLTFPDYTGVSPTSAFICGPAPIGENGPNIFTLGSFIPVFNPPGYVSGGGFVLTPGQITDLEAGLWYVNITSTAFPSGELRGQILPVPEPGSLALFGLGGLALWSSAMSRRFRSRSVLQAGRGGQAAACRSMPPP